MGDRTYSAAELSQKYLISIEQAERYIARFAADHEELDRLLAALDRTPKHRPDEVAFD